MLRIAMLVLFVTACGKDTETKTVTIEDKNLLLADSKDRLPTCSADTDGQLGFAKNTDLFYVCKNTEWTEIATKGTDGLTIEKTYQYQVTDYSSETDINTDSATLTVKLGDIKVYKLTNNSGALVTVTGMATDDDSSSDTFSSDFSNTWFLKYLSTNAAGTKVYETTYTFKLKSYAASVITYSVDITATPPTFEAYSDTDPNINQLYTSYTLSE